MHYKYGSRVCDTQRKMIEMNEITWRLGGFPLIRVNTYDRDGVTYANWWHPGAHSCDWPPNGVAWQAVYKAVEGECRSLLDAYGITFGASRTECNRPDRWMAFYPQGFRGDEFGATIGSEMGYIESFDAVLVAARFADRHKDELLAL